MTSGEYDDYSMDHLLEGPADLDMHLLYQDYDAHGEDVGFSSWLCDNHGCRLASYTEVHTESLGFGRPDSRWPIKTYPVYFPSAAWGPIPKTDRCSDSARKTFWKSNHEWTRVWDHTSRWWECSYCHAKVNV